MKNLFTPFIGLYKFSIVKFILFTVFFYPLSSYGQLPTSFQKVELLTGLKNSVNFEFAPDGRIFIVDRYGELIIYKPNTQTTVSAGTINVFHDMEDGLLAIAFDPQFLMNSFIYVHYSLPTLPKNRVSRFKMNGDKLDLTTEVVMLEWTSDRNGYYHAAGDMDFDSKGNLYIAIGDNTNHSAYSTLNETNSNLSSERTSSNTNDLRGKILRIKPLADGKYSIPEGNLFPSGQGGRPEIYVMGARNPFRIFVDKTNTDWLYWAEVGPDANSESNAGPEGLDEINLTKSAGNYGWPYFAGKNESYLNTYADPDFYYDPNNPVNISKWNTGAKILPPAQPSWLEFFHKCYLVGPKYYFDPNINNSKKLPSDLHERFFYYDFNTSKIWLVKMDDSGGVVSNQQFASNVITGAGFIDLKIGPDGQLYILEYGAGCCPDNVGTGKLVRVDYTGVDTNKAPEVNLSAHVTSGALPLIINFSSEGTTDANGDVLTYEWDFQSDGIVDSKVKNPSFTYTVKGTYSAKLIVKDSKGATSSKTINIYAGNSAATFHFNAPVDGGMINWGDDINYDIVVNDKEDGSTATGTISCSSLNLVPSFGHLSHSHDGITIKQCKGTFRLDPTGHDAQGQDDIYYIFKVNYTDKDGLTSFNQATVHPKKMEAEFYDFQFNAQLVSNTDQIGGGTHSVRALSHGSYIMLEGRNLININSVAYRVAATLGGIIEMRAGAPTGVLLSTVTVPSTGSLSNWINLETPITNPGGKNNLYILFKRNSGDINLLDLNYIEFKGAGVSIDKTPPEVHSIKVSSQSQIEIKFNEALEQSSAQQISNYYINNGISISSAYLQADRQTVVLKTSTIQPQIEYEITVKNLRNESGVALSQNIIRGFKLEGTLFRINAGGPTVQISGIEWTQNQYNNGGSTYSVPSLSINNTTSDAIYQTETFGNFTYSIPVPISGAYDIALHFAEIFWKASGSRIFNVDIENGQKFLNNYDIFAKAGYATAVIEEFSGINVTDGFLTIKFSNVKDNAKVSAIEVSHSEQATQTPSINILSPIDGALVSQPFNIDFSVANWPVGSGTSHIHKIIDGVEQGDVTSTNPIAITGLTNGSHTVKLVLVNKDHVVTSYSDQIQFNVVEESYCVNKSFPLQWTEKVIGGEVPYRSPYVFAGDMDGDGYKDIVTGAWWYKNPGNPTGVWVQKLIGSPMNNMSLLHDFDRDGDLDIFGTQGTYISSKMAWARNDGKGNFTIHTNIPDGTSTYVETFMAGAVIGNFNNVENTQIAIVWNGAESSGSAVQMLTVPADPINQVWTIKSISPNSVGEAISAGDIDKDGDLDLFQGANWLRNDNSGVWTTFSTGVSLATHFDRNALADIDKNGVLDGIVNQIGTNQEVSWIQPPSDPTKAWSRRTIGTDVDGGLSLDIVDMDGDGDLDVLTGEWKEAHRLIAFENDLCNSGIWIKHILHPGGSTSPDHHDGAQAVDLDNDGDLDIISMGWDKRIPRIYINGSTSSGNRSPVVSNPIPDQGATAGAAFTYSFPSATFTDADGDALTYAAALSGGGALPSWLGFNALTRTFSGTPSSGGIFAIQVTASDGRGGTAGDVFSLSVQGGGATAVRINAGGGQFTAGGGAAFAADQSFSGGSVFANTSSADIAGTADDAMYKSERFGAFSYNLAVPSGTYLVRLHFAELWFGAPGGGVGGAGKRVFSVAGEGQALLTNYDIYAEVGAMAAAVREFEVTVADGVLNLNFLKVVENPKVSAIEVVSKATQPVNRSPVVSNPIPDQGATAGAAFTYSFPSATFTDADGDALTYAAALSGGGALPSWLGFNALTRTFSGTPSSGGIFAIQVTASDGRGGTAGDVFSLSVQGGGATAVRINAGGGQFTAGGGAAFAADQSFSGGSVFANTSSADIAGTADDAMYKSERFGAFSYNLAVPSGTYLVRLHFAELWFGAPGGGVGGAGKRVFSVAGEGQALLTNYDIYAEVGAMAAAVREFEVTVADGVLNLNFLKVVENPKVSAIEVVSKATQPVNRSPVVSNPIPDQGATAGAAFTYSFPSATFTDADGDALTYAAALSGGGALPSWLGFNALTRTFSGTPSSGGIFAIQVTASDGRGGTAGDVFSLSVQGGGATAVRINAGGGQFTAGGGAAFAADQSFSGGSVFANTSSADIAGTADDAMYKSERFGAFSYNLAVPSGTYLVRLHFAELWFGAPGGGVGGAGKRVFSVAGEGQALLTNYDIYAEVGAMAAAVREFEVTVADGVLNLNFLKVVENPKVSAIEVVSKATQPVNRSPVVSNPIPDQGATAGAAFTYSFPSATFTDADGDALTYAAALSGGGALPSWLGFNALTRTFSGTPSSGGIFAIQVTASDGRGGTAGDVFSLSVQGGGATAVRINAGGGQFTAGGGAAFAADQSFSGGSVFANTSSADIAGTADDAMYKSERFGAFSYNLAVPSGTYLVRLHFAELWFGAPGGGVGGAGKRVFSVAGEGQALLTNYDIYAEVGAMAAAVREFEVTVADGVLNLNFLKVVENPKVSAIEVVSKTTSLTSATKTATLEKVNQVGEGVVVTAYPNPFNDEINLVIQTQEIQEFEVKIYNILGKEVYKVAFTSVSSEQGMLSIDLSKTANVEGELFLISVESLTNPYRKIIKILKE